MPTFSRYPVSAKSLNYILALRIMERLSDDSFVFILYLFFPLCSVIFTLVYLKLSCVSCFGKWIWPINPAMFSFSLPSSEEPKAYYKHSLSP